MNDNHLEIPLFFGIEIDPPLSLKISQLTTYQGNMFLHDTSGSYLQELIQNETRYLGKWIGKNRSLPELKQLETHIQSILTKILSQFDPLAYSLQLIPVPQIPSI